jgi:Polyketide cyclase / dehydrase and lipid transport
MAPMMRLILGLGVLVLILAAVALGLPAHVTSSRSVVINAPEYAVYPYLNNLHQFPEWSPWAARDPDMKVTYSGPPEGKGAKIEWESANPRVGSGSMQIIDNEQSRSVDLAANLNGLEGTSSYQLVPAGAGSKVTWSFVYATGSSPIKRWKGLMLDGFVGAEFSKGLENLKAKVEADRATASRPIVVPQPAPAEGEAAVPEVGETAVPETTPEAEQEQAAPAQSDTPPPPPRR